MQKLPRPILSAAIKRMLKITPLSSKKRKKERKSQAERIVKLNKTSGKCLDGSQKNESGLEKTKTC